MNSGELSQSTNHWYVTAGDGDAVVRVFPGMSLGETETGELSLDGGDALLSLSIGSDDQLVVFVVSGGELEAEDAEFSRRKHLALDSAALIKLPNNTLRFDKGVLSETGTKARSQPSAVWRIAGEEIQTSATDSMDTAQPPPAPEINVSEANVPLLNEPLIIAPEPSTPAPSAPERDEPQGTPVTTERPILKKAPGITPGSHKNRQTAIVASAGLVCVLIGLVYAGMRTVVSPEQPTPVARQVGLPDASRQSTIRAAAEEASNEASEVAPKETPELAFPDRDQLVVTSNSAPESKAESEAEATPAPAAPEKTVVIAIPPPKLIADDLNSAPVAEAATPVPQKRPALEVAETAAPRSAPSNTAIPTTNTAATPKNTGLRPTNRNPVSRPEISREVAEADLALLPIAVTEEAVSLREQEQAQTSLLMYERDLLAAELALAQGRLTQPPEDNAYTLYKQLVASYPESSAARSGFQALGAALVNRAFAELAAKRWSDARGTLTAAAEAGASPNLIANLSGEVDYQQRLADAQAGRFAALYPEAELVALNRKTPRLRRYAPDGMDMVQIEFTISVAGNVQDIEVLGAPPQRLERVVRQAVTDWRFEPVLSGTRPIPVRTRVGLEIP